MVEVILGLGSNIGDKAGYINAAVEELGSHPRITVSKVSGIYRTAPWGYVDQDWFVNACVSIETDLTPEELIDFSQSIEDNLGRTREIHWGPRTIDIDILVFGDETIKTDRLHVPHPRILERAFVLVPLKDVAPDLVLFGETLNHHLDKLDDAGDVIPH